MGGTKWFEKGVSLLVSAPWDTGREISYFIQMPSAARHWTTCQIMFLNRSSNNQTDSLPFQTYPLHLWSKPLQSPKQAWDFCLFSSQRLHTLKTVHPLFLLSCPIIFNFISSSSPTFSVPPHSSNLYFWGIWKSHTVFCDSFLRDCPLVLRWISAWEWNLVPPWLLALSLTELFQSYDTGKHTLTRL